MRAMVVDDSKAMRRYLTSILSANDFEVSEAADGQDALQVLATMEPPELVLVDWNMPNMDGLQLVNAIRADKRYHATRLMMVTSETETSYVDQALAAGANEYVMKPFTEETIVEKLALLELAGNGR
ncbi:MAG: response regulator [Gammaproteobacteria bacterium]|nr:response regulator [Gammaproteobacteria bacterium]